MTGIVAIWTTVATRDDAARIARTLVDERLAACVQIDAVESCYRWAGVVAMEPEARLTIKTLAALADRVSARLRALHAYALPELLVLPVTGGDPEYLAWIAAACGADAAADG